MNYRFEDCTNHNICLYHELNINMGFDKSIEIRRKSQELEKRMKKIISNPYMEEMSKMLKYWILKKLYNIETLGRK